MSTCAVCHAEESREELVDKVFRIDSGHVLVVGIPAVVCARCGEQSFSSETAEEVRLMIHGDAKAAKSVPMPVFAFSSRN